MEKDALGAVYVEGKGTRFRVWAPFHDRVDVVITAPDEHAAALRKDHRGYFSGLLPDVKPGARYLYRLDEVKEYPDPASRSQPEGVHGPSEVVGHDFTWREAHWRGIPLRDYIIYELHTGTFTHEGTFAGIIPQLDRLQELGVTAVELMPVAQFPGPRNWGYDGVLLYAPQNTYGGPNGLKRFVDECHQRGLAAVLDVVYNHLGPEGNHLGEFGPYFTERYKTPWGAALNFDGPYSDEVRRFFIDNALYWFTEYRFDALRLDALHAIADGSPYTFIGQLADEVHALREKLGRRIYLIGESSADDARLITVKELGGYGIDAQWNDDFHHSVRTLIAGDNSGYYEDYGRIQHLEKAYREGFVYSGEYSKFRKKRHGTSSACIPAERFVVFAQNHDQVGNRMLGDRLSASVDFATLKLAAGIVLLSPYIPLLFMGEEYGETAPFPYFVSHTDPELVEAVRKGRAEEFEAFQWREEIPDPQAESTFRSAKLDFSLIHEGLHRILNGLYRELIRLRKEEPALAHPTKDGLEVNADERTKTLTVRRRHGDSDIITVFNLGASDAPLPVLPEGRWGVVLDSSAEKWGGTSSGVGTEVEAGAETGHELPERSFIVFRKGE